MRMVGIYSVASVPRRKSCFCVRWSSCTRSSWSASTTWPSRTTTRRCGQLCLAARWAIYCPTRRWNDNRMASDDCYLVLPSNASMTTHPNNTLAQYITNLPRRISLSGDWECGLTEIHYPHDWYNVRNARLTVEHGDKTETDAYFEDGYYDSANMLVRTLNDELKGGRVKFSYEPVTPESHRAHEGRHNVRVVRRSPRHTRIREGWRSRHANVPGSFVGCARLLHRRLRRGFESLYVYSSIVEPRIVGDKIAPLLRIVPITGRHGEMVAARFDHVQYMPVLSREFEAVEIEIRDDTGRPVPFERGKVTVTLHLIRRRTGLF